MTDPEEIAVDELARKIQAHRSRREFLGGTARIAYVVPVVASFALFPGVSFAQAGGTPGPGMGMGMGMGMGNADMAK